VIICIPLAPTIELRRVNAQAATRLALVICLRLAWA